MQWLKTLYSNAELPGFKSPLHSHTVTSSRSLTLCQFHQLYLHFPMTVHKSLTLLTRHELAPGNFSCSAACPTSMFYALMLITRTRGTRLSQPSVFAHGMASSWNVLPIPHLAPTYLRFFLIPPKPELADVPLCFHNTFP